METEINIGHYPPKGTRYYIPRLDGYDDELTICAVWTDSEWDYAMHGRGLCFETKDRAAHMATKIIKLYSRYLAIRKGWGVKDD